MSLKDNIKLKRRECGLTLEEVAKSIGVSRQTVQKYESGVVANIPSDKIEKLAEALDTTPAFLMGWEDQTVEEKEKPATYESDELNELYKIFSGLTDERRKRILHFARFEVEQQVEEDKE